MMERKTPVPAVAAVILNDGQILLVKRGYEPSKGKWATPGGRVEWGETLVEAVKREVREETGLEVEVAEVAGVFDLMASVEGLPDFHYVIIDYFARVVGGDLKAGDDAEEVRWVSLTDLDDYGLSFQLRERLEQMGVD